MLRSSAPLLLLCCMGIQAVQAQPFTDEDLAAAKERQEETISSLERSIVMLEEDKLAASKVGNREAVKQLIKDIRALKTRLAGVKLAKVEEFAQEVVEERLQAAAEERRVNEAQAKAAAMARQKASLAAEAAAREATRLEESGNCPLQIDGPGFSNLTAQQIRVLFPDQFGPRTLVGWAVMNRSNQTVQAYEVLCELLDGFDEVIEQHSFVGPLLKSNQVQSQRKFLPVVETAVQMRVTIERVRLTDGSEWVRKLEHKSISAHVRRLAGAGVDLSK